jgi:hypothetical protein
MTRLTKADFEDPEAAASIGKATGVAPEKLREALSMTL